MGELKTVELSDDEDELETARESKKTRTMMMIRVDIKRRARRYHVQSSGAEMSIIQRASMIREI